MPNILNDENPVGDDWITMGRAGWADAATIVPWAVYESYGSDEVLVRQLDSMRRWVASLEARGDDDGLLPTEFQFGDWLDPDAPGDKPWEAKVSSDFVANAFFARSARLLADAERLVGDGDRAERADRLADHVATATWDRWGAKRSRPRPARRSRSSSASRRMPSASESEKDSRATSAMSAGASQRASSGLRSCCTPLCTPATSTRRI